MAQNHLANIKVVTPTDDKKIPEFNYIKAGGAGTISVRMKAGDVVLISAEVLAQMPLFPVGTMDEVLATGTTATDIYAW
jgi:UDP-N-acetyl-D-mannosaminuronate dehydrogenase